MSNPFDSDKWIEEKKLELVNLMFQHEFGIADFQNTSKVINFDDLQTEIIRDKINKYRTAMGILFKAEEVRSVLDYYYLQQDKKPVLNLLKQVLKYYGYEFSRTSEYQGNCGGKKIYKSRYTIIPIKTKSKNDGDGDGDVDGDVDGDGEDESESSFTTPPPDNGLQQKMKVIKKIVKTYKINVPKETQ